MFPLPRYDPKDGEDGEDDDAANGITLTMQRRGDNSKRRKDNTTARAAPSPSPPPAGDSAAAAARFAKAPSAGSVAPSSAAATHGGGGAKYNSGSGRTRSDRAVVPEARDKHGDDAKSTDLPTRTNPAEAADDNPAAVVAPTSGVVVAAAGAGAAAAAGLGADTRKKKRKRPAQAAGLTSLSTPARIPKAISSVTDREAVDDMDLAFVGDQDYVDVDPILSDGDEEGAGSAMDVDFDGDECEYEHGDDEGPHRSNARTELGDGQPGDHQGGQQQQDDGEELRRRAYVLSDRPMMDVARQWKLAPFLIHNLDRQQRPAFQRFFPIQALVIPHVLYQQRVQHAMSLRCRDVCIQASTGAGKTLAYVIPILQALHETSPPFGDGAGTGHLLRALVVLPSRDLAIQVHAVCSKYAAGSDLRVALAVGQSSSSFVQEQIDLLRCGEEEEAEEGNDKDAGAGGFTEILGERHRRNLRRLELEPANVQLVLETFRDGNHRASEADDDFADCDDGLGSSGARRWGRRRSPSIAVDVLVCTPGRLVDHLDSGTFTLQHLRYLVVDEADRLLSQRYHNWIDRVLRETAETVLPRRTAPRRDRNRRVDHASAASGLDFDELDPCRFRIEPVTWRHQALRLSTPANGDETGGDRSHRFFDPYGLDDALDVAGHPVQLQKFLVSATLTRDPQKLAALQLNHPFHFSLRAISGSDDKRYTLPPNLREFTLECTAEQKPLVLLSLLLERLRQPRPQSDSRSEKIVIFTSSVDSTHRLARLLQLLWVAGIAKVATNESSEAVPETSAIAEVSSAVSSLSAQERFSRLQSRPIIVCSDGLSRGMDLSVSLVVSYDVPRLAKTYVHRCGRTARAGQPGTTIVLIKKGQQPAFTRMRSLIVDETGARSVKGRDALGMSRASAVEAMAIPHSNLMKDAVPLYRKCLAGLRRVLMSEDRGELGPMDENRLHEFLIDGSD